MDIQLDRFRDRLNDLRLALSVSDAAKAALAKEGFDSVYGARPLKRAISKRLETPISRMLIAEEVKEGGGVEVDFTDGEFVFKAA